MDILNLSYEIVRQGTAIATFAEMMDKVPMSMVHARCETIIQCAKDILEELDEQERE